jgi:anti-sigma regulatory factor (Ser/Thr protein kinase)
VGSAETGPASRTWFAVANEIAVRLVPEQADWVLVHVREPVLERVRSGAASTLAASDVGPPRDGEPLTVVTLRHRDGDLEVALNGLVHRLAPVVGDQYGSGRVTSTGVSRLAAHVDPAHLRAIASGPDNLRLLEQLDLGGAVIAPVVAGGLVIGAINLVRSQPGAVDGAALERAEDLGRRIGAALDASLPATAALRHAAPPPPAEAASFVPDGAGNVVAAARRWARRTLPELVRAPLPADFGDDLDLVISELAGNAIRHAGGLGEVRLDWVAGVVRVSVRDPQDREPVRRTPDDRTDSGRGMLLVEAVSTGWGVDHDLDRGGKCVWVELAV